MKKFLALGLILITLTAAASAQSVSGDDFRSHRMTNDYNNRQFGRGEGYRSREMARNRMERFRSSRNHFEHRRFENSRFHHHRRRHRGFHQRHFGHGRRRVI